MPDKQAESMVAGEQATEILRVLLPTPIGPLGVELTGGVITYLVIDPDLEAMGAFVPLEDLEDSDFLDEVFGRFSEYFAGARRDLEIPYDLSYSALAPFERKVLNEVAKIPYGKTRTFQRIATAAGLPDGYRQVLAVLGENPLPILIPCHRVITNKSGVGSFIGGKERKKWLLAMEKEAVVAERNNP